MKESDVQRLGVYRIYWKTGGSSVSSIGQLYDGTLWIAPTNWTSKSVDGIATIPQWDDIEKVKLIEIQSEE